MATINLGNGIQIATMEKGGLFLGLGEVRHGDNILRNGRRPMFVEIRSPYGIELSNYRLVRRRDSRNGARLSFAMQQRTGGPMEWQVHECRRYYNVADWSAGPAPARDTHLELDIRAVSRVIGKDKYVGFSYQYRYTSKSVPIYMILDRGTWEIGGQAVGNEFWMRNCFAPVLYRVASSKEHYSTEWFLPSCANTNIFQFLPLQTELQGFSFTAAKAGILVTWATRVAHVRSLFEKQRRRNDFVHMHEHCGDLAYSFETAPMEVLFSPGQRDHVGRANAHGATMDFVSDALHAQLGMRRERVRTYGMIEEWVDADLDLYRTKGLPALAATGAKTIGVANHFQNNMNVFGVSNMCCTVDYKVAETVGEGKLRRFCQAAAAQGARVEMWANTSISTLTYIFAMRSGKQKRVDFLPEEGSIMEALKRAQTPFVRTTFGSIEADHYTPVFAVLNLRDPDVRKYWMKCWRYAHDRVGLGRIFLDSSFNLSSDKFHYQFNADPESKTGATADQTGLLGDMRPAKPVPALILSQYRAHLDLMVEMQKAGYEYCNEDLGVFGVHRHGPGIEKRLASLPMWSDCLCGFDPKAIRAAGGDAEDVYFRGLAYRMVWMIYWNVPAQSLTFAYWGVRDDEDRPQAHHLALLHAFSAVEDLLLNREILPGDKGVLYRAKGKTVLWAFTDFVQSLDGARRVRDVLAGTQEKTERLQAKARRVYIIS